MSCVNCIKKRVCYLVDNNGATVVEDVDGANDIVYKPEVGWCAECNICPERDCQQPYAYRVEWSVGCEHNAHRLYRDVCTKHANTTPSGCACSETAHDKQLQSYRYV